MLLFDCGKTISHALPTGNKGMRVGLIIYGSIDAVTGGYIYDRKLVDYLCSRGIEVKIFSQNHCNIFNLIKNNFSKELIQSVLEFKPDVLLQDEMNFMSLFLLNRKLKKIKNIRIISIVHLLQANIKNPNIFKRIFLNKIEYYYLKSVDGFIFNSYSTAHTARSIIKSDKPSIIAYPGKDRLKKKTKKYYNLTNYYRPKLLVIFIGNLSYNKGLHILLQALAQIDNNLWQLSVIGDLYFDVKYSSQILKMVTQFKLVGNIKFLGTLDEANLNKELLSHHVLAVPSYYESYGIVYAEAMGAGLPVIAGKLGGSSEIIANNCNGFLVTPGNIQMLKDVIYQLITNRELLIKMSQSSLSAYQNLASWDETMQNIHRFILENCAHSRSS